MNMLQHARMPDYEQSETTKKSWKVAWARWQVLDKHTMLTKQILSPTSGGVVPGEMMALVGPSGAGVKPLSLDCKMPFCDAQLMQRRHIFEQCNCKQGKAMHFRVRAVNM